MRIDPQAFLTGAPQAVQFMRADVIRQLDQWQHPAKAGVLDAVLRAVDAVPYPGDPQSYIDAVIPMLTAAYQAAMAPLIAAAQAHSLATQQRTEGLERAFTFFLREFEEFRRMRTDKKIH